MLEEDLNLILLVILMGFALYSTQQYPKNRIFSGFWLIAISIFAIMAIRSNVNEMFCVLILLFNTLLQILHIAYSYSMKGDE